MILCSAVMGLGTSIGGYRIIKSVGMDMVRLETYQGIFSGSGSSSMSAVFINNRYTGKVQHIQKTTAIMGVGAAKGFRRSTGR